MKILSLEAANILRLSAAYVTVGDDQPIVTVSGQNGHGKTSLLTSIAMALGGKKLCPPEPLKRGKDRGHVTVDLGSYKITRRFWRGDVAKDYEIHSSLEVTSPDGATFKSPQALLDRLVSDLTFDPLAFLDLAPAAQREYVRKFVGLDFATLDQARREAMAQASTAAAVLKMADRDVAGGDRYPGAPGQPVDVAQLLEQLAEAERLTVVAEAAERLLDKRRTTVLNLDTEIRQAQKSIEVLNAELLELHGLRADAVTAGLADRGASDAARAAVPDTAALRAQLAAASEINAQVAANVRFAAVLESRDEAQAAVDLAKRSIVAIDFKKQTALESAAFPVPGLAFSDDGLTFDGLPFEQASYAQQLRVAVAMGLATNPELKVLLIKHGNALDAKSLALLTDLAEQAGAQVWLERVAETPDGVSIFIQDGVAIAGAVA